MKINKILSWGEENLLNAGIITANLDSQVILAQVLKMDRSNILAHPEQDLTFKEQLDFRKLIHQRTNRLPLARIIEQKEFYGLNFAVSDQTFIPRPESETLVEIAIRVCPKSGNLVEVGAGSGALAIAISKNRPDLIITAIDKSDEALRVARKNAKRYKARLRLIRTSLLENVDEKFDCIIANLPYLSINDINNSPPEVQSEPLLALFGGAKDGLKLYRKFITMAPKYLKPRGYLIVESNPWQQSTLIKLARRSKFNLIKTDRFITQFGL